MSELKKTAKFAAIYGIGVLLNRSISFIMLPIYTRFLTPSDYGIIELLTMTIDVISMFVGLGIGSAVVRFYYKYEDEKERNEVISTLSILILILYTITSVIGYFSSPFLAKLVFSSVEYGFYFKLTFIALVFQPMAEIPFVYLKAKQKPILFVILSSGKLIIQLSLNIYFVVILKMGVLGVLYSTLGASAIVGLSLFIYTIHEVGVKFSRAKAVTVILFGAPFIISNLGDFILTFSDRYFLKAYASLADVGLYSLGYKFGFLLWVMVQRPVFNIWQPQRFEIAKKKNARELNYRTFFYLNLLLIAFALGVSLFGRDLFRVMSEQAYWSAYKIIPLIMIAYIIQGWTAFGNFGALYNDKTKIIAQGTFTAAISIIILSFILIPTFKSYGAAMATIIAFFIRFYYIYWKSQKEYPLDLPWSKVLMMLLIAAMVFVFSLFVMQDNLLFSIVLNGILFFVFLILLLVFPVFSTDEKEAILKLAKNPTIIFRPESLKK